MKLSAVVDFPDDSYRYPYTPEMVDSLCKQLADYGVSRLCFQYHGNAEDEYCMNCDAPDFRVCRETSKLMPNHSRVFVEAAKRHGMEAAVVMRPQEQGDWFVYSPYFTRGLQSGVPHLGGKMLIVSKFMREHPELRIKRRTYDLDYDAVKKVIGSIKLYKQNDVPSRITKENITIYTSPDNSYYKPYNGDFTIAWSVEEAKEDVILSWTKPDYGTVVLTEKGAPIQVLTLSGLSITDQFVAVGVKCDGKCDADTRFVNTPVNGIACFTPDGTQICASPGGTRRSNPLGVPHLDGGFNFDDGFGAYEALTLDPDGKEGYFAIAKGKNEYAHGAMCECEPAVQEFWLELLEKAMEDGYDFVGNRLENHAVHVDEPFAYGYNDCIKEEYFRRYGACSEEEMELSKIAKIRGDAYTKLFVEAAKRVRAKGKKVYLTLNIEMLHDPIPLDRRYAYPMNVEWQWEKWLEEIKPDEINFRMYYNSIDFLLSDPQCLHMIDVAKTYNVPLTVERYIYWDFPAEYKKLRETGDFDRMALYETAGIIAPDGSGDVVLTDVGKRILPALKEIRSSEV